MSRSVALYEAQDYRAAAKVAEASRTADPSDDDAWRMQVRALLATGDGAEVARTYAAYVEERGGLDDVELVRELAQATLGQGLRSPSVALRIASIRAVEQAQVRGLADAVAERMTDGDDRVVAAAAAAVLRGYADAANALDDMLHSQDEEARRIALDGLGRKVAAHAVDVLVAGADDASPAVRETAVRYLGILRAPSAVAVLLARTSDHAPSVRAAAVRALAAYGKGKLQEQAPRVAADALRDEALPVRIAAVELASAAGATALLTAALDDREISVALAAARELRGEPTRTAAVLDRALASADWTSRAAALNNLVALAGTGAAGRARASLQDPAVQVRLAAARVIAHHGEKAEARAVFHQVVAPLLEQGAARNALDVAIDAAVDLVELGDPRGALALSSALRAPEAAVRAQAVAAHALAGKITPGLVAALADPSGSIRIGAAAVLVAQRAKD